METYGGQAVIEGVMMRSARFACTAVRLESGKIKVKIEKLSDFPFSKTFFLRGVFNLVWTLRLGFRSLNWSADQQMGGEGGGVLASFFSIILGVAGAVAIFKLLPFFVASSFNVDNFFLFNLIDASVKLSLFIIYLLAISLFSDVRRIFQYHGAEHKVIGCFESGKALSPKSCAGCCKEHRRCGTNFIFSVIVISMLFYFFIPLSMGFWLNFCFRILLLPLIAGLSYELIRLSARDNAFTKIISYPGILVQKLTTREPGADQLEVAVAAMKTLIGEEKLYASTQ